MSDDIDVLRERIKATKDAVDIKLGMMEKNVELAREELNRRLEGMNEFRAELEKQARTFITDQTVRLLIARIEDRVSIIEKHSSERIGSTKWSDHIITVLIGIAVVVAIWIITHVYLGV